MMLTVACELSCAEDCFFSERGCSQFFQMRCVMCRAFESPYDAMMRIGEDEQYHPARVEERRGE